LLLSFAFVAVIAQQVTVKGKVTDETGEGAIGVNIIEKGTSHGVITDIDGNYSITISSAQKAVLQFSSIGYNTKEEAVNGRTSINIALTPSVIALGEVVAIGYGTQKKVNLTGAVGFIDGKQMENRSVQNMAQALQGKVANLNISTPNGAPGSSYNFNIRGYTGINADDKVNLSNAPLVVIDGVQGGDLSSINMNDVENISVLKDAASSAIYGSSAPFGVIIVTTKKGKAGKPVITYNNNFGFAQPTRLPHYTNSIDFAEAFNEVGENSRYTAKLFDDEVMQRIKDYQSGKIKDETMKNPAKNEWYSWNAANANNDWFDIYFKKAAFSQQHNIGVSGATETSNYYVGLGYNQQDGLYNYANDGTKRYNVRANISSNLTNWLTFGFRSAMSRNQTDVPAIYSNISGGSNYSYDYFHQIGRTYPTVPLRNPDGYFSEGSGIGIFTDGGRRKETTDKADLTGELALHILPGWDATANYTYSGDYIENSNHRKTFYTVLPNGDKQVRGGSAPNYISRNMYKYQHHTINAFTSYEKTFGKHSIKALAGFTQELYDKLSMSGANDNLYSDEIPMLSMTYGTNRSLSDAASQLAIRGGFGRINYNYEEKYLIELNGRYDGTSRFLKDVRNKFYPGMSAAWVISKESFWESLIDYVNTLKLRGSYGSIGEQSFTDSYYPFYPSLGNSSPTGTNWIFSSGRESSFNQPGLVDPSLTWQTTSMLDFGFDLAALSNRLNITFDWYRRHVKDFVVRGTAVPAFLGVNAPLVNNGEMETKGFDISIGWKDRIGEVSYGANFVLSDYTGRMLKYDSNPTKLISSMYYEGMTMGEIWGYETVGLFKDQAEIDGANQSYLNANWYPGDVHYKDLNGDGKINIGDNTVNNPGDRKIIGNSTPRYSFGLTLNGEWKGFDATIFLQGVGKRDIMFDAGSNYFWGFVNNEWQSSYFTVHTDRWTTANPNGYYPRAYFNTDKNKQAQSRYLQNAAYLRFKNVQLGYTIPKAFTDKIKFQKARLFVNVENLATFTKLINIVDPEIVNGNAKVYPLQRTWAFGINLTF
jgi:TonB-linked SusC/RagA family outer membrane protein